MTNTEVPAGNQETAKSGSDGKRSLALKCERIWLSILIAVVVIGAIAGIATTLVLERNKRIRNSNYNNRYDDDWRGHEENYYYDDDDKFGEPIETDPFEVDLSQFSSAAAAPYTSVEDVKADIEAVGRVLANRVILSEANGHLHHRDVPMASVAEDFGSSAKGSSSGANFFRGMDDFATYQHELGAVKSDMVKSNGEFVFTAVDSRIEVWDTEGNLFEATKIQSGYSSDSYVYINALLLNPEGTKLTVIASDAGRYNYDYNDLIDQRDNTVIAVYDIEGSSLTLVSRTHIDGYHTSSYSVGDNIHIVTSTSLNTWRFFDDNLSRWSFRSANNTDYVEKAVTAAEDKSIPNFVDQLVEYVTEGDRVELSPIVGIPANYKSLTQVYSFDGSAIVSKGALLDNVSRTVTLGTGYTSNFVYATSEWLWFADETYQWDWIRRSSNSTATQETTLVGLRLDGGTTTFAATTTFPGVLLSQFSIDFVEDNGKEYVRVATTQTFANNFWWEPMPMPEPMPVDFIEVDSFEDDVEAEEAEEIVAEPLKRKLEERSEPRPILPPPSDSSESRTLNEVIIFEIPSAEDDTFLLTRLGSVEIGKIHEIITAIRFFGNRGYVVTFERTDPFYVLDLSDPENPTVLGELEVPGFSEFMHPINADNSLLLTVGQDANEMGWVTGFQVSLFDSTDPTNPTLLDRLVLEGGSSSASWDERAFRYIQAGEVGRLIIPLYQYDHNRWGDAVNQIEGFTVFGVDLSKTEEIITRELDINHYQEHTFYDKNGCYCGGTYLPERSLVFDGNLMTMKSQLVVSTDLGSGEALWDIDFTGNTTDCCGW